MYFLPRMAGDRNKRSQRFFQVLTVVTAYVGPGFARQACAFLGGITLFGVSIRV